MRKPASSVPPRSLGDEWWSGIVSRITPSPRKLPLVREFHHNDRKGTRTAGKGWLGCTKSSFKKSNTSGLACACVHVCATQLWRSEDSITASPYLLLVWVRFSCSFLACLDIWGFSCLFLCRSTGIRDGNYCELYMGSEDLNSGPLAWVACRLSSKPISFY